MSAPKTQRLKFFILSLSFVLCALHLALPHAFAQSTPSAELIDNAQNYDGKKIIYSGEVIGDIMVRGEHAWVNVHDGQQAIGIWLPKELTAAILYKGNYKAVGDWIEITGTFHQVCKEHAGELDIHATSLKRAHSGYFISRVFNRSRMNKATILLAVLGSVWILIHLIKT